MRAIKSSKTAPTFSAASVLLCGALLALCSAVAVYLFYRRGWNLYYGDAECHLDIARRMVDSQTPGYRQVGTVWLPLTHWILLPFVRFDSLWFSGLAGALPFAFCYVVGGCFLFAATRRVFESTSAAVVAVAVCALNPNLLYIQTAPMTETLFFACLAALFYFTVRYRDTQAWWAAIGAGLALLLATLTRYDGWFLIPFVGLYFLVTAQRGRWTVAIVVCCIASLGPAYWLLHNQAMAGDALDFYRGPYSAKAIQGSANYPGKGYWPRAFQFFFWDVWDCAGAALAVLAALGMVAAFARRAFWALVLLWLPGVFYLLSMHSGGTPIFVPHLYSGAYYNVRYGLSILPLLAVCAGALVAQFPWYWRTRAAVGVVVLCSLPWLIHPQPESWVVYQEGNQNYRGHREVEHAVEDYLRPRYVHGAGIVTSFGATTVIYRELGIPLRETLTSDNGPVWWAEEKAQDPFPHYAWAVVRAGDWAEKQIQTVGNFTLEQTFQAKDAPEIHVYRRKGGGNGSA